MENIQLSKNFYLKEFKSSFDENMIAVPEQKLVVILQGIRSYMNKAIVITDGPRTIPQHIKIYKKKEKQKLLDCKKWYNAIPWGSRHLSKYGYNLRAVDFKCIKEKNQDGTDSFFSGEEMNHVILLIKEKSINFSIGLGIGKRFIHLDIDRKSDVQWGYLY